MIEKRVSVWQSECDSNTWKISRGASSSKFGGCQSRDIFRGVPVKKITLYNKKLYIAKIYHENVAHRKSFIMVIKIIPPLIGSPLLGLRAWHHLASVCLSPGQQKCRNDKSFFFRNYVNNPLHVDK